MIILVQVKAEECVWRKLNYLAHYTTNTLLGACSHYETGNKICASKIGNFSDSHDGYSKCRGGLGLKQHTNIVK